MPDFPQGPEFTQERFIEAFRGLTQVLIAAHSNGKAIAFESAMATWKDMFNALIGTEEEQDE